MNNFLPYVTGTKINDFTREELFDICLTLELEYRGGSMSLDTANVKDLAKGNSVPKLSRFTLHTNIVNPIIDKENTTYINPPTRTFATKKGGKISKRVEERLIELYQQTRFDLFMTKAEKFTSLLGTALYKPVFDPEDNVMNFIEIYPSNGSLTLIPSTKVPGKIDAVSYEYEICKIKYCVWTDRHQTIVTWEDKDGQEHTDVDEHNFGILPFSILKFKVDNSRPYGPPDYELFSLCKHRSLVLANTMARLHLSDLEKLLLTGIDIDTAMKSMRAQIIALPSTTDTEGNTVQPTAQFISPDGQDALNLLEAYFKLYNHIMDNRGHQKKVFSVGSDIPSAESLRLGGMEMANKNQEKKKFLTVNEQELFIRMVKENNRFSANTQIPEDTKLVVDYQPDPFHFANASDEVTYFEAAMRNDVETPVRWIKHRQGELSIEDAEKVWENNKVFNDKNKDIINDELGEPTPITRDEEDDQSTEESVD